MIDGATITDDRELFFWSFEGAPDEKEFIVPLFFFLTAIVIIIS